MWMWRNISKLQTPSKSKFAWMWGCVQTRVLLTMNLSQPFHILERVCVVLIILGKIGISFKIPVSDHLVDLLSIFLCEFNCNVCLVIITICFNNFQNQYYHPPHFNIQCLIMWVMFSWCEEHISDIAANLDEGYEWWPFLSDTQVWGIQRTIGSIETI